MEGSLVRNLNNILEINWIQIKPHSPIRSLCCKSCWCKFDC